MPREVESGSEPQPRRPFVLTRMKCSNWRFALFLLIMSGFWTSFNQIFITMPEYIRDFTDTRPAIRFVESLPFMESIFGESKPDDPNTGVASKVATINEAERVKIEKKVKELMATFPNADEPKTGVMGDEALQEAARELLDTKIRIPPQDLEKLIVEGKGDTETVTNKIIIGYRQFNPEFLVNINAGAIVLFQVLVSFLMARFHRFTTMIVGMVVAAVGIALSTIAGGEGMIGIGGSVWIVAGGLLTFSFGEMMASPTSQEYVGRIAPREKVAMYMGYYFVAIALGNLFGGILSGELYGSLARDMQRPDLMWLSFGGLMLFTAIIFLLYNKLALPKESAGELTNG